MANDLAEAKKERVKSQYYTGSAYMKQEYQKRAISFQEEIVNPFLQKINKKSQSQHKKYNRNCISVQK